jgi:hypothetical protein
MSAMTIEQLVMKYNEDYKREIDEFNAWRDEQLAWARGAKVNKPNLPHAGFKVDFAWYMLQLKIVIQEEFNFTDAQAEYIVEEAYNRSHSGFSAIFDGAHELAEFVAKFPKGT